MRTLIMISVLFLGYQSKSQTISPETIEKLITQQFQEINFKLYQAVINGDVVAYSSPSKESKLDLDKFIEQTKSDTAVKKYNFRHQGYGKSPFEPESLYNSGIFYLSDSTTYNFYAVHFKNSIEEDNIVGPGKAQHGYLRNNYPEFLLTKEDLESVLDSQEQYFIQLCFEELTQREDYSSNPGVGYIAYSHYSDGVLLFEQLKKIIMINYDILKWFEAAKSEYTDRSTIPTLYKSHPRRFFCCTCTEEVYWIDFPLYLTYFESIKLLKSDSIKYFKLGFESECQPEHKNPSLILRYEDVKEILNNTENTMLLFILDEFFSGF